MSILILKNKIEDAIANGKPDNYIYIKSPN